MKLPEKKSFQTNSQYLIEVVLSFISRSRYIKLQAEYDDLRFMADTISKHTKIPYGVFRGSAHICIPKIEQVLFKSRTNGYTISGGSAELDADLSKTKAKGEILERTSVYLPLRALAHRENHTLMNTLRNKQKIVKSLLGFRFKRARNDVLYYGFPGQVRRGQAVSTNGCAGHFSWDRAVLKGLLELIERDAFLVHWLNTISPARIQISHDDFASPALAKLIEEIEACELTYHFLDITSDIGVPACACIIGKQSLTGMRYFVGAGAGFSLNETLASAAREAIAVMSGRFDKEPHLLPIPHIPFSDTQQVGHQERMRLYFTKEMEQHFAFFINSPNTKTVTEFLTQSDSIHLNELQSIKKQLAYVSNIFMQKYRYNKKWDVFIYSFNNSLLRKFNYYVVRVMCPAMYDMYFRESEADPNHPRLKEFVFAKGLEDVAKLNIWPHPFP